MSAREIERDRDADLVQRGDCRRDVLGALDAVDARQQRRDRIGAVALDRGFIEAAGPEVAEQFLHAALSGSHRCVEQVALLLLRAFGELGDRRHRATCGSRVRFQPVGVGDREVVGARGRCRGRLRCGRGLLLLLRERIGGRECGDQGQAGGKHEGTQVLHRRFHK